ncbi:spermidine/putrescine ABC transporter permease PotC [soil metagenome]
MKKRHLITPIYQTAIYLFLYTPIFILIVLSFNNAKFSMVWHGASLQWYQQLFDDSDIWVAAWHSLLVGTLSATIATTIGTLGAVSLYRYRFFGRKLLYGLIFILIVAPDIVTGVSLLTVYSLINFPLGFWSLLLAHVTFSIPFAMITVYSRLIGLDENIFEAAKDLGAKDWTIFFNIMLPLLKSALLASWLLCFTLSLDDVIISYFVTGPDFQILPLQIYSMVRSGINPEVNALCAILFAVTLLFVIIIQLIMRKKKA